MSCNLCPDFEAALPPVPALGPQGLAKSAPKSSSYGVKTDKQRRTGVFNAVAARGQRQSQFLRCVDASLPQLQPQLQSA